jgi:hypothetical protein
MKNLQQLKYLHFVTGGLEQDELQAALSVSNSSYHYITMISLRGKIFEP